MKSKTFIEIFKEQKNNHPLKIAYTFLLDGEAKKVTITYKKLYEEIELLGNRLSKYVSKSDKVLILYQPGIDYIIAFFACLFKGYIAVPVYPPDTRNSSRINGIIKDSKGKVALCSNEIYLKVNNEENLSNLKKLNPDLIWLSKDILEQEDNVININSTVSSEDITFLQYTSGSTSSPKGVMISHRNLIANCDLMQNYFKYTPEDVKVSWLPPYHDMGLIGTISQIMYTGMSGVLMSPSSFIRKPSRWLKAITESGKNNSVISGGPNFAYEMCCNFIDNPIEKGLNLSNWRIAYNGAEPIKTSTLKKFTEKFSSVGFKPQSFNPVYGLAEATLMSSCGGINEIPIIKKYDLNMLTQNIAVESFNNDQQYIELVSCGHNLKEQNIAIVDPLNQLELSDGDIGEIWIKGASVAKGYWQNDQATKETFNLHLKNTNDYSYMCTGDLGFFDRNKNLFITGRSKELIIIRGQNYYPQDIEKTVEETCDLLRPGCGGAFSINTNNEILIVVYELQKRQMKNLNINTINKLIKEAVFNKHGLLVSDFVLLETSSFPKTTSGKLQRQLAKKMYLNKELKVVQLQS